MWEETGIVPARRSGCAGTIKLSTVLEANSPRRYGVVCPLTAANMI